MTTKTRQTGPWLRRLRRAPWASAEAVVGAQWAGAELALARVSRSEPPLIEQVAVLPAPPESRAELVKRLAQGPLLRGASVVLTLAPGQYDLHQVAAPAVPADELHDALRWQLRASLAYAPEEAALDFVRIPRAADSAAKETLLVVAAHRPTIDTVVAPFITHGVAVEAVEVPEFGQRNLDHLGPRVEGTSAWLGFERETCLLTTHVRGELAFARRMLLPGANLNAIDADLPESAAHVTERIVTQAQRTLDTFERQSGLPAVSRITVGPHRHARAIVAELAERLGIVAEHFDAGASFEFDADAALWAGELPAGALAAIGAALRSGEPGDGFAGWIARRRSTLRRAA